MTETLTNNPNGILNPGRFVFYERMHTLTKELYVREHFKLLFRVTTAFLDMNCAAFQNLYPIEVMVTAVYHCHLQLAHALPMLYSLARMCEIAMTKPFADGKSIRMDECEKKLKLYPKDILPEAQALHDELQRVTDPAAMITVFTAVLVDNYILENLLVRGNEARCVQAAQAAATRIFTPLTDITGTPGRYYQEMLQLGMKIINSVKKRSSSVVAPPSTSHKKARGITA